MGHGDYSVQSRLGYQHRAFQFAIDLFVLKWQESLEATDDEYDPMLDNDRLLEHFQGSNQTGRSQESWDQVPGSFVQISPELVQTLHEHGMLRFSNDVVASNHELLRILVDGLNKPGSLNAIQNLSVIAMTKRRAILIKVRAKRRIKRRTAPPASPVFIACSMTTSCGMPSNRFWRVCALFPSGSTGR